MKTSLISAWMALQFLLSYSALGQATFELRNRNPFVGLDAPVFDAQGTPLAGTNYLAELWGGMTIDSLSPAIDIEYGWGRLIVPFSTRGYFYSWHIATIPSIVPPGGYAWLQVRAWDARLGSTYEEVAALGLGGYGESPLFYARGGNPLAVPPELPCPLIGLQSFSLRPIVPEPSSWALLAVAATASCWLVRRYRRGCPSTRPSAARH